jgi:polysaccharide biosynthesis PFTS motif protein
MNILSIFLYFIFFGFNFKNKIILQYKKLGTKKLLIFKIKNKLLNFKNKNTYKIDKFFITECNIADSLHQYLYGRVINSRLFNILLINSILNKKKFIYPLPVTYLKIISQDVKINFYLSNLCWYLYLLYKIVFSFIIIFFTFFSFLKFKNNLINIYLKTDLNVEINKNINLKKKNIFEWVIAGFKINKKVFFFHNLKNINKKIIIKKKYSLIYKKNNIISIFYFSDLKLYFYSIVKIFLFIFICISKLKKNYFIFLDEIFYYFLFSNKKKVFDLVFFDNSNFSFRPLWTFLNESIQKNSVHFYFYSTNNYSLSQFITEEKHYETLPIKLINWPNYIFWNQKQLNFFKNITNKKFNYRIIEPAIFEGKNLLIKKTNLKRFTIFDITPKNNFEISSLINPFNIYSLDYCISFLSNILEITNKLEIEVFLKTKRNSLLKGDPIYWKNIKKFQKEKKIKKVILGNVSAESIIKHSDAVICIPFTSAALLAETMNVKSIYYDPTGRLNSNFNMSMRTPLIKNKLSLKKWIKNI